MTAGLFTGRLGWVNAVLMTVQGLAFLAGAYAGYKFFLADAVVDQLRWGLPGMTLLLLSALLKSMLWPSMQADRVIGAVRRLEFQLEQEDR